jgi:hypothetical protein
MSSRLNFVHCISRTLILMRPSLYDLSGRGWAGIRGTKTLLGWSVDLREDIWPQTSWNELFLFPSCPGRHSDS